MAPRSERMACDRGSQATFVKAIHRMDDQNLLSRAPPCFRRHFKPCVLAAFAVVCTHSSFKEGLRTIAEFSSQHDENNDVPGSVLNGIRVEKRKKDYIMKYVRVFAVVSIHSILTSGRRPSVKIIADSLSQHDEKHLPNLFSWDKFKKIIEV
jgi:hypothetical protein